MSDKAQQARQLLRSMQDAEAVRSKAYQVAELLTGHPELHLAVAEPGSTLPVAAFSARATESLSRLRTDTWLPDASLDWRSESGRRMVSLATATRTDSGWPYELVVSADRGEDEVLLRRLLITAGTAAPLAIALVALSAIAIVRLGLEPLRRFRDTAALVSAQALSERIETAQLPAELRDLGLAFNSMLDRLDEGVGRLSQFSTDLAHEMRTPLATALGRTQVALSRPRSREELLDVMEGNIDELERLSRLITDMLFLAQAEHAPDALQPVPTDLAQEAKKVAEFVEVLAEERNVRISIDGAAPLVADRNLVQRAITNLLSNAVRHSEPGAEVIVTARRERGFARLDVVNRGEPIDPEHLPRLFDRFYRADRSRARDGGGTGLGLAIVQAIAALHGGRVEAANGADRSTRFTLYFPVDEPPLDSRGRGSAKKRPGRGRTRGASRPEP